MAAADLAVGKWDLENSENFDEYMKELGVGFATRLIGNKAKPRQEISIDNGEWTIKTSTSLSGTEIKFKPGVPFQEKTMDGRNVTSTCTIDGNKLIQNQKAEKDKLDSNIVRDFKKDSFLMTLTAGKVTCTREYKKVN
ncbi:unnamed protein product [Lymnaea stagnalis]|uniref:Cytosolic fatty-acid binding proteins domain-containing protein n=1 Tax=Lymnaea stagnalis TaxID=6523 RepID=A0AAV2HLE3_LYMST